MGYVRVCLSDRRPDAAANSRFSRNPSTFFFFSSSSMVLFFFPLVPPMRNDFPEVSLILISQFPFYPLPNWKKTFKRMPCCYFCIWWEYSALLFFIIIIIIFILPHLWCYQFTTIGTNLHYNRYFIAKTKCKSYSCGAGMSCGLQEGLSLHYLSKP